MNTGIVRACVLAWALALGGCATAYQSKGFGGGFSETALSPDTFKIDFAGNGFTSAERASDFAILRAADKSLELGCHYFGVMNEADSATVSSATIGTAGWGRHGAWAFSNTVPIVTPNTVLLVKCFREPVAGMNLFDAHFIARSIRAKYGMKGGPVDSTTIVVHSNPAATDETPASRMAMAAPVQDIAAVVRSAQQIASQQGCAEVHSTGGSTFQASCTTFTLVIDCDGGSCRPLRAIQN